MGAHQPHPASTTGCASPSRKAPSGRSARPKKHSSRPPDPQTTCFCYVLQCRTALLSTKDSDSGLNGDAADTGAAHLSTDGSAEDLRQLQCRRHAGPQGSGDFPAVPGSPNNLALGDALRPAKADFVEIEVGMLGADVVKDTGHRALHSEIEALDRIGVNRATNIFAPCMLNGLVCGEVLADSDKRLPLVAHQVSAGLDVFIEHAFDFIHREIGDYRSPGIAGRCAPRGCAGPLYHRQDRALRGAPQTFATAARRRFVGPLLRPSAEKELVDLDCAAERVLAGQHQA